jgi:hypothetical protein
MVQEYRQSCFRRLYPFLLFLLCSCFDEQLAPALAVALLLTAVAPAWRGPTTEGPVALSASGGLLAAYEYNRAVTPTCTATLRYATLRLSSEKVLCRCLCLQTVDPWLASQRSPNHTPQPHRTAPHRPAPPDTTRSTTCICCCSCTIVQTVGLWLQYLGHSTFLHTSRVVPLSRAVCSLITSPRRKASQGAQPVTAIAM